MAPLHLVLFGDQTVEKLSSIQSLVHASKTSPAARRFLQEATDVVQLELSKLSLEDRRWNHDFHSLLGLAEDNTAEGGNLNGIIATILMCVGRLGEIIVHAEEDPSILGSEDSPTEILAFCTGLLPAAVLVAAKDTSELFGLAREIISITARMAAETTRRMRLVEDSTGDWAVTIIGRSVTHTQAILDKFHTNQNFPMTKRIAIGVVSTGWLTLVGAPSSMKLLMEWSEDLSQAPKTRCDTNGPVHTKFMPSFDIDKVLGGSHLLNTAITSKRRILSPGSCLPYAQTTLHALLSEMLLDIGRNVLHLHDTLEKCVGGLVDRGPVSLTVAGPTGHLPAVQRILESKGIDYQIKEHKATPSIPSARGGSDRIAIVGMAGRFPGSETIEGFWEALLAGETQIKKVPKSRFDIDEFYDPPGKTPNSTAAQHGTFLDQPGLFDSRLFNISPREAAQMDPIQRLLLTTSYEALEMAGYSKDATLATESQRIATFFGQAAQDWVEVMNNQGVDIYYVPGLSRAFAPSRLNHHYGWGGGSYALDSACASSTTAITLACSSLIARECDTALAGGGSILLSPNTFSGLSKSGMISSTGGCRTYHDDADGYARGEGIGVVVLKRLEDAISDNDNVLGVIRGWARTYTSDATSMVHPSAASQSKIYRDVLHQAGVKPNEVSYVEMHGTGTQAGDYEEIMSVANTLSQSRSRDNTLTVGAVKANVGHGEGAAGVTSLIKVLMMMQERTIPTQPAVPFKLNKSFPNLEKLNMRIADRNMTLTPSPAAEDGKLKALVNSFDASGGNSSLLLEGPPKCPRKAENTLPSHLVVLSARTNTSLQKNRRRLLDYLARNPETKLADLAYTTTARRTHEVLRAAYTGRSTREITNLLRMDVSKDVSAEPKTKPGSNNVAFAFTGQGSSYAGMGRQLYKHSSVLREVLHIYQQIAASQDLPSFIHLISDEAANLATSSVVSAQLALVALEIAVAHLLKTWGVKPDIVIGHSLGEYSALCVAGVLSVSDTLFLVGRRAHLMEQHLTAGEYTMLAIDQDVDSVRHVLTSSLGTAWSRTSIACINAPKMTVVSGPVTEIEALRDHVGSGGSRATILKVPYGFHSAHIQPILGEFEKIAQSIVFSSPTIPVASTLSGEVVGVNNGNVFSPAYLTRQARECVNFLGAINAFSIGYINAQTHWLELGPEPVCLGLIRRSLEVPNAQLLPISKSNEDNWTTMSSCLATLFKSGASIDWREYYRDFKPSLSLLSLPTYAFDAKDYWTPYVKPVGAATNANHTSGMTHKRNTSKSLLLPGLSTTDLQWIEEEKMGNGSITVTFAARTSDAKLYDAIQGHKVDGLVVCPLSIFCGMAKSAAQYAYSKIRPGEAFTSMSVSDLEITRALVVPKPDAEQVVKTKVSYSSASDKASIVIHSVDAKSSGEHGSCQVTFEDSIAWFRQQSQTSFLVKERIDSLKDMGAGGKAHRLLQPVIYKLFENLVAYGPNYKGMQEVWMDAECRDAVANVRLPNTAGSGNFQYNPFWIDTIAHLAGFLLNAGLKYPTDIACLSLGFENWRSLGELQCDKTYTTYVNMQETDTPSILLGTAYVYDGDKLIHVTTNVKFQSLKKSILRTVLLPPVSSAVADQRAKAKSQQQQLAVIAPASPGISCSCSEDMDSGSNVSSVNGCEMSDGGCCAPASAIIEDGVRLVEALLCVVAEETGYDVAEMQAETAFADMGVDSLMSITITAVLNDEVGVELPATFFLEHPTVGEARTALLGNTDPVPLIEPSLLISPPHYEASALSDIKEMPIPEISEIPELSRPPTPHLTEISRAHQLTPPTTPISCPIPYAYSSKAILLQGVPSPTSINLFLLPDSSGSAGTYIQLPAISATTCVYALESPFLKTPSENTYDIPSLCAIFLTSIKCIQPHRPYLLGGFSLGALYAYEIARKLLLADERVDALIIIDMAVPLTLSLDVSGEQEVPTPEQLRAAGLLPTKGRQTEVQKMHACHTVKTMMRYQPKPCVEERRPKCTILISAGKERGKQQSAAEVEGGGEDSEVVRWAKGRSREAKRGWGDLLGTGKVEEVFVDGTEHFGLLKPPGVNTLGKICGDVLARFDA